MRDHVKSVCLFSPVALVVVVTMMAASAAWSGVAGANPSMAGPRNTAASTTPYRWGRAGAVGPAVDTPHPVAGLTGTIVQLATSNSATYALTSDGTVWAWGWGHDGQLGNGHTNSSFNTAVKIAFPTGVAIAHLANPMPYNSAMAVDSTGHVWGWGFNDRSSMCMTGADLLKPTKLPGIAGVTLATGQGMHSMFDEDGTVVACGVNSYGELGDGTKNSSVSPVAVEGLPKEPVLSLVSSWHGSGALMADGSYYDWGINQHGEDGVGTVTKRIVTPQLVSLPSPVVQVFQGGSGVQANGQTLALLSNGTVWAWGLGQDGQLGNGGTSDSALPVQVSVPNGVTFVEVASGGLSSYAVDSTGAIWSWGPDNYGALGNHATSGDVLTPTAIAGGPFTFVSSTAFNVSAY